MGGGRPPGQGAQQDGGQGMPQGGQAPGNGPGNAQGGGFPGGGAPGQGQQGQGQGRMPGGQQGGMPGGGTGEGGTGGGGGGMGGLLDGASVDSEAKTLLKQNADAYTWTAAAIGSQNAASYQLATGDPVMAIGGFNGSDPSPTLAQFKKYVEDGEIHYFISGGMGGGGMGGEGSSSRISAWVQENFEEVTVGSATFYDLTRPTG